MKIGVCVSLVPDSTTKVKISDSKKSIDESQISYILNPYDEFAVEEALKLREKNGGEVFAVSFGSERSKEAIKKAFQMGADKGVLIKSSSNEFDSYNTARNLADYFKDQNADIILFGKQSIDFDGLLIPTMVAEMLNLPSISVVVKLDLQDGRIIAEREVEGGKEILESSMPIVIGAQKGINEPRYPNLKNIMAAKSKPIEEVPAFSTENKVQIKEMNLPASKSSGKIFTNGKADVAELVRLLREEAKVI